MGCDVYEVNYDDLLRDTMVDGLNLEDRLSIAKEFNFNQDLKEGGLTFEYRFMLNHCNNLGERYTPQTAQVVIMEFRKFMALNATKTLQHRSLSLQNLRYENI